MERNVVGFTVVLSPIVPQEVVDGDCVHRLQLAAEVDVFRVLLQQATDLLHYQLSQQAQSPP